MGLNCTHGAWDGAYSAFHSWRLALAKAAELPPLDFMEGFYIPLDNDGYVMPPTFFNVKGLSEIFNIFDESLPIKWSSLKPMALYELLYHSDCEGDIKPENCNAIADDLEKLIPLMPDQGNGGHIDNYQKVTKKFVDGLRKAAENNEPLKFR